METSSASGLASMVATAEGKRTCPLTSENSTSNLWLQCLQSCWRYFEPLAVFARPLAMAIFTPPDLAYGLVGRRRGHWPGARSPRDGAPLTIEIVQARLAPLREQHAQDFRNGLLDAE